MSSYTSYCDYGYQPKNFFASGLSKVMDLGNFNQIDYPQSMTNEEAQISDFKTLENDFKTVGKDIREALNSYGRKHTN